MSREFRFRHFTVMQEKSAFKVGTDSVLLGAWADVANAASILDIGTGTGILALMCAQRNTSAWIKAIDIDEASVLEAKENFSQSKWDDKLEAINVDIVEYARTGKKFDHIISNPPYFSNGILPGNVAVAKARHMAKWDDWLVAIVQLLEPGGMFSLILPSDERNEFVKEAAIHGLHLTRECRVCTRKQEYSRVMLELSTNAMSLFRAEALNIYENEECYSDEYRQLTKDFYLFF